MWSLVFITVWTWLLVKTKWRNSFFMLQIVNEQNAQDAVVHSDGEVIFRLYVVDCVSVREALYAKARGIAFGLLRQIMDSTHEKNLAIRKQYETMEAVLLG